MTLPASGQLQLGTQSGGRSINSEFGLGNDLQSYLGVYYGRGGVEYRFPVPGNSIGMDLFYSTYAITGGSQYFGGSTSWTIPVYNTITVTCVGGSGGGAGQYGYIQSPCYGSGGVTGSQGGSAGGGTSFGGYVYAAGGGGGSGNAGGGSPGGVSSQSYTNPVQGGSGPTSGSSISVSVGGGGGGGQGGCFIYQKFVTNYYYGYTVDAGCACWDYYSSGGTGSSGYVQISWT